MDQNKIYKHMFYLLSNNVIINLLYNNVIGYFLNMLR